MATVLTPHAVRRVCVVAECSPPTVRAYLDGRPIRPSIRERIERAMRELGYDDGPPASTPAPEEAPRRAAGER